MDTTPVHDDLREFLRLLNEAKIEYLVVGGYAVAHHGYQRPTLDMDIWVAASPENARKIVALLNEFIGMSPAESTLTQPDQIIRMGRTPVRLELFTSIKGVEFAHCYARRSTGDMGGVPTPFIGLAELRTAKRAAGRLKDLADLEALPPAPPGMS